VANKGFHIATANDSQHNKFDTKLSYSQKPNSLESNLTTGLVKMQENITNVVEFMQPSTYPST